jgi:hypothetical protein
VVSLPKGAKKAPIFSLSEAARGSPPARRTRRLSEIHRKPDAAGDKAGHDDPEWGRISHLIWATALSIHDFKKRVRKTKTCIT